MVYKYTGYYYLKNGKTGSEEFTTGYDLRTANELQRWHTHVKFSAKDVLEYDIYDSNDVLIIAERWDEEKEKWNSLIRKKNKDKEWHPFGL